MRSLSPVGISILMVALSFDDYSKIKFFSANIEAFSFLEVERLLVTCKRLDRMLPIMWDDSSRSAKNLAAEKALKKYYNLCTKLNVCGKYQVKTSYINMKLG